MAYSGKLKLRKLPEPEKPSVKEETTERNPVVGAAVVRRASAFRGSDSRRKTINLIMIALSWTAFLALAGLLGYFRFIAGMPGVETEELVRYGLIGLGACYVFIIMLALKNSMFDGLLCIVVPFYPFYYILFVSNLIFVRAVVAAVLVVFGYDLALFLQDAWGRISESVNLWIESV